MWTDGREDVRRREAKTVFRAGWEGDQKTVVALKLFEAKAAERRVTQGRRLTA